MCMIDNQRPHDHSTPDEFEKILQDAIKRRNQIGSSKRDGSLESDAELADLYQIEERKKRALAISNILNQYGQYYQNKVEFQNLYRKIIFWGCSLIVALFCGAIGFVVYRVFKDTNLLTLSGSVTIAGALISFVVSILELIRIIMKYCFPENDEEYIIEIVKSIQQNDLENLKEMHRTQSKKNNKANK